MCVCVCMGVCVCACVRVCMCLFAFQAILQSYIQTVPKVFQQRSIPIIVLGTYSLTVAKLRSIILFASHLINDSFLGCKYVPSRTKTCCFKSLLFECYFKLVFLWMFALRLSLSKRWHPRYFLLVQGRKILLCTRSVDCNVIGGSKQNNGTIPPFVIGLLFITQHQLIYVS